MAGKMAGQMAGSGSVTLASEDRCSGRLELELASVAVLVPLATAARATARVSSDCSYKQAVDIVRAAERALQMSRGNRPCPATDWSATDWSATDRSMFVQLICRFVHRSPYYRSACKLPWHQSSPRALHTSYPA